jgi:membrane-associated protein
MCMLPGIELTELISAVGVLGIMAIIFAESGLLLGFFLPGDTLLFSAGLLATKGVFGVSIHVLVLYLIVAAIMGEAAGYWFGRKVGHRIFKRKDSMLFNPDNLMRAEKFYEKYGPVTIMLARFVPVVRTFVPIVAGAAKMDQKLFTLYNVLGAVLWISLITYVGYFAGDFLESRGIHIDNLILPIIGVVTLLTLSSPIIHILREKESREQFFAKIKGLRKRR